MVCVCVFCEAEVERYYTLRTTMKTVVKTSFTVPLEPERQVQTCQIRSLLVACRSACALYFARVMRC